jgi:hypothetical protein
MDNLDVEQYVLDELFPIKLLEPFDTKEVDRKICF